MMYKKFLLIILILFLFLLCNLAFKFNESFDVKEKIVVCFFGVIPRSIKYTWNTIKENIIDPLKGKYDVDIYVFNMNVEDIKVDDVKLNQEDINIIPYTYKEEELQTKVDEEIDSLCKNIKCKIGTFPRYNNNVIKNSIRQMYSEYRTGLFLEKNMNKYKKAIVCGSDYFLVNKINLNDFLNSDDSSVYTSDINDWGGVTNGFYFGKCLALTPILKRYEQLHKYLPSNENYEYILKQSIIDNNINRKITNMSFFKIRANKKIHTLRKNLGNKKMYEFVSNKLKAIK